MIVSGHKMESMIFALSPIRQPGATQELVMVAVGAMSVSGEISGVLSKLASR